MKTNKQTNERTTAKHSTENIRKTRIREEEGKTKTWGEMSMSL